MQRVILKIAGMSCGHCVMAVNKALKATAGVSDTQVVIGSAQVSFDPAKASVDSIKAAVDQAGYEVVTVQ